MVDRSAPFGFPGYSDDAPLDLGSLGAAARQSVVDRLVGGTFDAWADAAARVGHCAHPIRLVGSSRRVDRATGEVLSSYSSAHEPFGVTYVRCGNRRASVCPACSRTYARDTFEMIRAGVVGGQERAGGGQRQSAGLPDVDGSVLRSGARGEGRAAVPSS
ncbi:hypothetical protein B277_02711 [Janibacter hoylei PVAS-1]|uniref:Replication initiation protein n=1 Tax=Janibacter hoylei PVAS-1 TaxID=1210046 RepID=K1ETC5_9MICO|nr:replication initiator [Janibacter hoylei]EKA62383.1 hypothetical protein B277_02711 [Janibacter hoylei PVAS-1]